MFTNKAIAGFFSLYIGVLISILSFLILSAGILMWEGGSPLLGFGFIITGIILMVAYFGSLVVLLDIRDEVIRMRKHFIGEESPENIKEEIDKIVRQQEWIDKAEQTKKDKDNE